MKIKVQAQHMQPGDVVGSGERVQAVWEDVRTPSGKINVLLAKTVVSHGKELPVMPRKALWGKYTQISVERA